MSVVFINHPLETWTPTGSGALATIIWECCRVAERRAEGRHAKGHQDLPWVITRSGTAARFPWARTLVVDPPELPVHPLAVKALRARRKLTGWRHLRHRAYAFKVVQALRGSGLYTRPLVLINDPEMTVYLRRHFPRATILHWFQNQLESSPRFRRLYPSAADLTAGVSGFTSRWIENYYKIDHVPTLYNGVDLDQFHPAQAQEGGGEPEPPTISFVGRTGIEKAPDLLLRAALALSEKPGGFRVLMIGSNHWDRFEMDDYQRCLQDLTSALEARGVAVLRPGHVGRAALPSMLRRAQIHAVTSRWDEPFGLTTVEGMASGLAVVASDTGGTPEVVGDAGFLFERDSAEALAARLEPLVAGADLRADYGRKARARAAEFPWERTWATLTGLLAGAV